MQGLLIATAAKELLSTVERLDAALQTSCIGHGAPVALARDASLGTPIKSQIRARDHGTVYPEHTIQMNA